MALDTLTIVRRLEAARIDRQQAEAIADVLHQQEAGALAELASKADVKILGQGLEGQINALHMDLRSTEQRLDGKISALRAEMESRFDKLDARFESLEQRMTIKLGSMIVVALGVVAVLVKLL